MSDRMTDEQFGEIEDRGAITVTKDANDLFAEARRARAEESRLRGLINRAREERDLEQRRASAAEARAVDVERVCIESSLISFACTQVAGELIGVAGANSDMLIDLAEKHNLAGDGFVQDVYKRMAPEIVARVMSRLALSPPAQASEPVPMVSEAVALEACVECVKSGWDLHVCSDDEPVREFAATCASISSKELAEAKAKAASARKEKP